jgi:hypothetical protein
MWRGRLSLPGPTGSFGALARRLPFRSRSRRGAATLDYVLVAGIVLPMVLVIVRIAPRMISAVYEMTYVLVSWPFL